MDKINTKQLNILPLESLLQEDSMGYLRSITFHSDGTILVKTGRRAPKPDKIYSGSDIKVTIIKLILDNYV